MKMDRLEHILKDAKRLVKTLLVVGVLYGVMEANYQLPYNIRALREITPSTPSAIFKTREIAQKALEYQDQINKRSK